MTVPSLQTCADFRDGRRPDITPVFSPSADDLAQQFSLSFSRKKFKMGRMLCYPANRNSNPVQRTQSISLFPLKPDVINLEQTRRCDYEIPAPLGST